MADALLVLNAGSSSLKFPVFLDGERLVLLLRPAPRTHAEPRFVARDTGGRVLGQHDWAAGTGLGHEGAIEFLFGWGREGTLNEHRIVAAGHRVVHGGVKLARPVRTAEVLGELESPIPLAPCTSPTTWRPSGPWPSIAAQLPQVGLLRYFIPPHPAGGGPGLRPAATSAEQGVRRYGFHGLSYEYIASVLPGIDARAAHGRTVVAHLGNGLCALRAGQSVATTMGFTAVDGLVMGTRCGALDPGVLSS